MTKPEVALSWAPNPCTDNNWAQPTDAILRQTLLQADAATVLEGEDGLFAHHQDLLTNNHTWLEGPQKSTEIHDFQIKTSIYEDFPD